MTETQNLPKTQAATLAILRERGPQNYSGSPTHPRCSVKGWNLNAVSALVNKGLARTERVEVEGDWTITVVHAI